MLGDFADCDVSTLNSTSPPEYHKRVQIKPDILSGLIWVQTICKGYQQMTKVATSKERVNLFSCYMAMLN